MDLEGIILSKKELRVIVISLLLVDKSFIFEKPFSLSPKQSFFLMTVVLRYYNEIFIN